MLVSYSDSEGSENEPQPLPPPKPATIKPSAPSSTSNFAIDKSTGKIKVNLNNKLGPAPAAANGSHDDEPAAKRPRLGGPGGGSNAFSGFNSMLPAPKRDNALPSITQNGGGNNNNNNNNNKSAPRKVFSLRTGAEPAFSRESDAELRDFFAEQQYDLEMGDAKNGQSATTEGERKEETATIPKVIPKPAFAKPAPPIAVKTGEGGKAFMFKPLSVARGGKKGNKKKTVSELDSNNGISTTTTTSTSSMISTATPRELASEKLLTSKPKVSLFSAGTDHLSSSLRPEDDLSDILQPNLQTHDDDDNDTYNNTNNNDDEDELIPSQPEPQPEPQSLASIATELNLTPSERRQLLGRQSSSSANPPSSTPHRQPKIITFNTAAEYAHNQHLLHLQSQAEANGTNTSLQHNPVRAIGGGKHSLKSLITSAQGQKDALEESFAQGRRNRKEAGGRYGW